MEWSVVDYLRKGGNRKRKKQNKTYIQRLFERSNEREIGKGNREEEGWVEETRYIRSFLDKLSWKTMYSIF